MAEDDLALRSFSMVEVKKNIPGFTLSTTLPIGSTKIQNKVDHLKLQSIADDTAYLDSHPEVSDITDFILVQLFEYKPKNVLTFVSDLFAQPNIRTLIESRSKFRNFEKPSDVNWNLGPYEVTDWRKIATDVPDVSDIDEETHDDHESSVSFEDGGEEQSDVESDESKPPIKSKWESYFRKCLADEEPELRSAASLTQDNITSSDTNVMKNVSIEMYAMSLLHPHLDHAYNYLMPEYEYEYENEDTESSKTRREIYTSQQSLKPPLQKVSFTKTEGGNSPQPN